MLEESVSFIPSHSLSDVPLHKPRLATFCTSKTLQWIFVGNFPRDTGQNTFFGNLARCMSPPSRITNHRCFISEEVLCFLKPCWKVIMMGRTGKNSKWTIIIRISKNAPGLQEQLAVPGANGLLDLHRMETGNGFQTRWIKFRWLVCKKD